jgi:hypothetical protein
MTKNQIIFDLHELEEPLHMAQVSVRQGYLRAALAYLDDIESEAVRLRKACEELAVNTPPPVPANFLHPNDPSFVPLGD